VEDKRKQIVFLVASSFVIHPEILIFSIFKIASLYKPDALPAAQPTVSKH